MWRAWSAHRPVRPAHCRRPRRRRRREAGLLEPRRSGKDSGGVGGGGSDRRGAVPEGGARSGPLATKNSLCEAAGCAGLSGEPRHPAPVARRCCSSSAVFFHATGRADRRQAPRAGRCSLSRSCSCPRSCGPSCCCCHSGAEACCCCCCCCCSSGTASSGDEGLRRLRGAAGARPGSGAAGPEGRRLPRPAGPAPTQCSPGSGACPPPPSCCSCPCLLLLLLLLLVLLLLRVLLLPPAPPALLLLWDLFEAAAAESITGRGFAPLSRRWLRLPRRA